MEGTVPIEGTDTEPVGEISADNAQEGTEDDTISQAHQALIITLRWSWTMEAELNTCQLDMVDKAINLL